MQTCQICENEACYISSEYVAAQGMEKRFCLPMKIINHIGTDMNMIIRVAESTNPEHLEKLRELRKRFEEYRNNFIRYYSQLMNRG